MPALFKKIVSAVVVQVIFTTTLTGCSSLPSRPDSVTRGDYESTKRYVSQLIQHEMNKHDVTGLSIALVDDQKIVWAQGFGYADKAKNIAAAPETVYRTGSISKLFTDSAVMQLVEQGKLDIDRPLQTYLPEFSIKTRFADAGPITPRNIMTHHSGLPDSLLNGMWRDDPESFTKMASHLKDDYTAYPPNYIFSYSNIGITLLGDMIQKVTGRDFSSYLDQSMLQPIGMVSSSFSTRLDGPLASKAYRGNSEAVEKPLRDVPAGGLNSTVLDLGRFMQMVFAEGRSNGHRILEPATLAEMLRQQNNEVALDQDFRIGLGWMLSSRMKNAGPVAQHAGATMHHRSQLVVLPEHKLGVVVLANSLSAGGVVGEVANAALSLALEVKTGLKQPRSDKLDAAAGPLTKEALQTWPGQYVTSFGYTKVTNSGNGLHAEISGKSFDLIPRVDGRVGLKYRLLGIIPIQLGQFAGIGLSQAVISNRNVLLANNRGQKFIAGEKMIPQPISEKWMDRLGEYEFVNATEDALKIDKVSFLYRDGFLMVQVSVSTFAEGSIMLPIAPVSDTEAVVLGLGRGKGETIRVVTIDGKEHAAYSGYLLRKKAQ